MRSGLAVAIFFAAAAAAEHRPDAGNGPPSDNGKPPKTSDTIYLPKASGPPLPPAAVVGAQTPSKGRAVPDRQLFIVAIGLEKDERAFRSGDVRFAEDIAEQYRKRFVGSLVRIDAPIDRQKLETAALAKEGFRRAQVLFVGPTPSDRWALRSESGWLDDKLVGEALTRLAVRLHLPVKNPKRPNDILREPSAVHAALFTANAGAVDCARFPGPVFGMSAERDSYDAAHVENWLASVRRDPTALLPAVAPQWFEVLHFFDRGKIGNHEDGWVCPAETHFGYRGRKHLR